MVVGVHSTPRSSVETARSQDFNLQFPLFEQGRLGVRPAGLKFVLILSTSPSGGQDRNRTDNTPLFRRLLYRWSYLTMLQRDQWDLNPTISSLTGRRGRPDSSMIPKQCDGRDSNSRMPGPQPGALPLGHRHHKEVRPVRIELTTTRLSAECSTAELRAGAVGETGIEPAASRSRTERSTKLSYSPMKVSVAGFEPATTCTPSKCSTKLSYTLIRQYELHGSGREDLNLRPPAPKAGALPN